MSRNPDLLTEIERGALDSSTDLADVLRKCVALGGATKSAELRAWASRELKGYAPTDEFPSYRITHSAVYLDAGVVGGHVSGQQLPRGLLPAEIQSVLDDDIHIHQSVAEIADLISERRRDGDNTVKLSPPSPQDLVALINYELYEQESPEWRAMKMPRTKVVERIYWQVTVSQLVAILDTIRTTLIELVAEMRAGIPAGGSLPSQEVAQQAFAVVVRGGLMPSGFEINPQGVADMMSALQSEFDRHRITVPVDAKPGQGAGTTIYNGPVFQGDANGAQLAWNNAGSVTQNQTKDVAPGFEALAEAVADILQGLETVELCGDDRDSVTAASNAVVEEITSERPNHSKVRSLLLMLKGALAPMAIGAAQQGGRDAETWAKHGLDLLAKALGAG